MSDKIDDSISHVFQTTEISFSLTLEHLWEMWTKQHKSVSEFQYSSFFLGSAEFKINHTSREQEHKSHSFLSTLIPCYYLSPGAQLRFRKCIYLTLSFKIMGDIEVIRLCSPLKCLLSSRMLGNYHVLPLRRNYFKNRRNVCPFSGKCHTADKTAQNLIPDNEEHK